MLLRKKPQTLRSQEFIEDVERFISEGTGHRWNRLSSEELYAYYYEFNYTPILCKNADLVKITMQDLINTFRNKDQYIMMLHEDSGLFYPTKDETNLFMKLNHTRFDFTDLINSLNRRITFFLGELKEKRNGKVFLIQEIQMYIPSEKDTLLRVDSDIFDVEELENLIKLSNPKVIDNIYQNGSIMSNFDANSADNAIPSFEKEFFIFTKMQNYDSTIVINYNP